MARSIAGVVAAWAEDLSGERAARADHVLRLLTLRAHCSFMNSGSRNIALVSVRWYSSCITNGSMSPFLYKTVGR